MRRRKRQRKKLMWGTRSRRKKCMRSHLSTLRGHPLFWAIYCTKCGVTIRMNSGPRNVWTRYKVKR